MSSHKELDLSGIQATSIYGRESKVSVSDFAVLPPGDSFREFWASMPRILAAEEIRALVRAMEKAKAAGRPIVWFMGAHVIKAGLSPMIIALMEMGYVSALGLNGAGSIHDSEVAMAGATSEDVAAGIARGDFGMSRETSELLNGAIKSGVPEGLGIGGSVGRAILNPPDGIEIKYPEKSLFASAYRLGIPATVHIAIGTDIIHMHPSFDPALAGEGSHRDFRIMANVISGIGGGVILNIGSSVILPLIVEKSIAAARNMGMEVGAFTGANFDFIQHYRPNLNPVKRARELGGRGISITGHHELTIPLIYWALKTGVEKDNAQ